MTLLPLSSHEPSQPLRLEQADNIFHPLSDLFCSVKVYSQFKLIYDKSPANLLNYITKNSLISLDDQCSRQPKNIIFSTLSGNI